MTRGRGFGSLLRRLQTAACHASARLSGPKTAFGMNVLAPDPLSRDARSA